MRMFVNPKNTNQYQPFPGGDGWIETGLMPKGGYMYSTNKKGEVIQIEKEQPKSLIQALQSALDDANSQISLLSDRIKKLEN